MNYEAPEMEVVRLNSVDVITTSTPTTGPSGDPDETIVVPVG